MTRVSLSEDELRGLTQGEEGAAAGPGMFEPADFSDGSRAAHRLLGRGIARLSAHVGGALQPLPPEIRLSAAEGVRATACDRPDWSVVLEMTGQFRARALLAMSGAAGELVAPSRETRAALWDALARDIEVAFRSELGVATAVELQAFDPSAGFPLRSGALVSLDFDLEVGRAQPIVAHVFGEASLVRDLARLIRPRPQPARRQAAAAAEETVPAEPPGAPAPERRVRLTAELGRCELALHEASALEIGRVVLLDTLAGDTAVLTAGGTPVAAGEVVVADGRLALRVLEVSNSKEWAEYSSPECVRAPASAVRS